MAETNSPQPQAVEERPEKPSYAFSFSDLESYIQEENLQYALVAKFSYGRLDMIDLRKIFTRHFEIKGDCNLGLLDHRHVLGSIVHHTKRKRGMNNQCQCQIQRWTPWFNPKEETPIALAWISFSSLSTKIFAREALFSLASAVGTPLQVDKATTGKSRPSVARVKVEVNLLPSLPDRVRMFFNDEKRGVVKEVLQKIVYDKLPSVDNLNKEKHATTTIQERVNAPGLLRLTATSGQKEDTEAMLLGTLNSKISEQLGAAATNSSTPVLIDVEAQNNADNNFRELIVTSQVATRQLSSRFVKDGELGSPNAVVVTKSRQDEAKQGNSTAEKLSNQWTLVSHKKTVDSKSSNNHILHQNNSLQVELDRSNSVVECTQFDVLRDENFGQYEGLHGTTELSAEFGNNLDLEKQIEQTGKLKERCHDDHTDQQSLVTHEKESIVTEEIDGKEINPNTPAMFISNQEVATDLNEAKEKQEERAENHTPSPSKSKLSPQALEFVPAILDTSSNLSATKVNLDNRDILPDLGSDMSDGDDENDMLDICFDKVAKKGDLSPRQQRSGSTKCKKKDIWKTTKLGW
ncbi:hypothetical protein H5410_062614 [Solanum commersonii]|uniref:DUF4283 domain-containing protein n=1 Tax=Solanum commersonii TaxID=4109 RepID=A0A9J5WCV3_SOLCO|nr:hypothetical protein H5410_062614 [Solanum commersonii]